ncbi:MAG: MlaE family lipid ABC transporter permease subunit [Spirochaetia bacterium]
MKDGQEIVSARIHGETLEISGSLTKDSASTLFTRFHGKTLARLRRLDIHGISRIDTSGIALIEWVCRLPEEEPQLLYERCPGDVKKLVEEFLINSPTSEPSRVKKTPPFFERSGGRLIEAANEAGRLAVLTAEIFFWSVLGIFKSAQRRKHSVLEQCWIIGVQSLPLVALLSVILGVILALQSAIQLKAFGANVYVADLMAISMVSEMGPMMTAIMIAGRSGSAIASELATMKVSEEIEALQVMGIDPIRYVVVPKFLAITLTIPLLVAFSIYLGIGGGMLVGAGSLDIAPEIFIARASSSVGILDITKSLTKSVFFGWVIVVIGSHFGFSVSGGAEEVGRATTMAVVFSIITVIVLDALFSLTVLI